MLHCIKNILLTGAFNKPIALDLFFKEDGVQKPVVIYAHGFNGFKDWGNFDLVAQQFAAAGFVFLKFNFSHNGTTTTHPEDFADLDAFGNNNYSKQLTDISLVTDWLCNTGNAYQAAIDRNQIYLIGHSMGGGICILHAANDNRIKKIITWASISECKTPWGNWPTNKMKEWKTSGVQYYTNSRTQQQLPLYYQLYEDYIQNTDGLDIEKAIKNLSIPILLCQGTLDTAVPLQKALDLKSWQPSAQLFTVESDHVFGRTHPWKYDHLPSAMQEVVEKSIQFLI
jgi:uncharacterized protein